MRVHGVKTGIPAGSDPADFNVDQLWSSEQLEQMLPQVDFVALCLPLTPGTRGFFGEAAFAALRPEAYLINVGRGATVDEVAMIRALQTGRLAGAALDVVADEPLDPASPLWAMPNVLISPHSASTADDENAQLTVLFCDNLKRYVAGRPLRNVVDKRRGY
jgi:phosphoglycerate dehydrogenase-like enzyme